MSAVIEELARERLGFERLRPGQLRAVQSVTHGRGVLAVLPAGADAPFAIGSRVVSERWGEGTVQRYDTDQVTVLFDEHGYRELHMPPVLEHGLLRPAPSLRA